MDQKKHDQKKVFLVRKFFNSIFSYFQEKIFSWILKLFTCKRKVRMSTSWIKSFLPPSLVFYPTFVTSKVEHISVVNMKSEQTSRLKKWCKKLVRGVKNFWIFSSKIFVFYTRFFAVFFSAFFRVFFRSFLWSAIWFFLLRYVSLFRVADRF